MTLEFPVACLSRASWTHALKSLFRLWMMALWWCLHYSLGILWTRPNHTRLLHFHQAEFLLHLINQCALYPQSRRPFLFFMTRRPRSSERCVCWMMSQMHVYTSFLCKSKASLHVARKCDKLKLQSFSGPISLHIHIIQNDSHSHLATLVVAHSLTTLQSSTLLQRPLRALRALRALHSPHVLPIPLKLAQRANFVHV